MKYRDTKDRPSVRYLISVQHCNGKIPFVWLSKEGKFDFVEPIRYSIKLITQHVNGMTPFDLVKCTVIR